MYEEGHIVVVKVSHSWFKVVDWFVNLTLIPLDFDNLIKYIYNNQINE